MWIINKICMNGLTYRFILQLNHSVQLRFSYHPVSLCVAVITLINKLCVMRLVDFPIAAIIRMPVNFFDKRKKKSVRSLWPQVPCVLVWACCDSRWKSSGCWSSQSTNRHNFQTIWRVFLCKNVVIVLTYTTSPLEVLAVCTKDSAGLTMALFLVCAVKRRESNRLELWCGISKQLLHEWQSQGLVIWTWENPGGAGGEETAAAAEPLCTVWSEAAFTVAIMCRKKVWETEKKAVYPLLGQGNIDII